MNKVNPQLLIKTLKTKILGRKIIFFERVDSTNKMAWDLADKGEREGTLIMAETQERGRGRLGRPWFSPEGGLWASLILRPSIKTSEVDKITLMAGVSIAESIREKYGLDARLKWVNDVLIHGRKISGVLAESSITGRKVNFVVLGIGVNVNIDLFPAELREIATSLAMELGKHVSISEFALTLISKIEENYLSLKKRGGSSKIINKWKKLSDTIGRTVEVSSNSEVYRGKAINLDENGFLILKTASGELVRIATGTCRYL